MKLIYKGKFDGNTDSLPCREHMPNAVKFKEPDSPKKLALIANGIAVLIIIALAVISCLRAGFSVFINIWSILGIIFCLLTLFPHEILHAICFKKEVYLYTNLKYGMLFVVGPETMSKGRFIFMSLLPNIVFGIIPFIIFIIFPKLSFFCTFGIFAASMGAGDYLNVFNALTQMPKGSRTYLYKFNSYWYIPEEKGTAQ